MSTSGGTRAATAATSRKVKQELVNMLFGKKYKKTGPEGHRLLDYSIYSYNDLRKAYLERLQVIHPDKHRHASTASSNQMEAPATTTNEDPKKEFQKLQEVWAKYDEMAKSMMKVSGGDGEAANFTLFGVGCSFSDNDFERQLRSEITDQACRGWFSSGLLAENSQDNSGTTQGGAFPKRTSLVDDSLFVEESKVSGESTAKTGWNDLATTTRSTSTTTSSRKTLIPGFK